MNYIEDILHLLVDSIGVDQADTQILTSISRQSKKGVALTDRQFELVSQKINTTYKQVLSDNNIVFDDLSPRLPLREIDRSKYITIVDSADVYNNDVYESKKEEWKWIKIRFPFSKKDILCVERIANDHRKFYYHKKE